MFPLAAARSRSLAPAGSSTPPLPPVTDAVLIAGLYNFNPVGYPDGSNAVNLSDHNDDIVFITTPPYPVRYSDINPIRVNPYSINTWYDASASVNNLTATGSARPTLQITSAVEVTGAGTAAANGTYMYRGMFEGKPYYNLEGQPDSETMSAVVWGGGTWNIRSSDGSLFLYISANDVAFPWQATFTTEEGVGPAPTVAVGSQSGMVVFDGVATYLVSASPVYATPTPTATIYLLFRATDLMSAGYLFAIGRQGLIDGSVTAVIIAGVLTVSVTQTGGLNLENVKVKTIADNNWHLLTVVIDTFAGAADQVLIWVDNSNAGVTAPVSADLAGTDLSTTELLGVGGRTNGGELLEYDARLGRFQSNNDDQTARDEMWAYVQYLQTQNP